MTAAGTGRRIPMNDDLHVITRTDADWYVVEFRATIRSCSLCACTCKSRTSTCSFVSLVTMVEYTVSCYPEPKSFRSKKLFVRFALGGPLPLFLRCRDLYQILPDFVNIFQNSHTSPRGQYLREPTAEQAVCIYVFHCYEARFITMHALDRG